MDLNDPRRRLQVLNQTSPSIRLATSPTVTPQIKVASPTTTPQIQIAGAPNPPSQPSSIPLPAATPSPGDNQFKGYTMDNPKTKTIFGLPVGNLMGRYGKTYSVKANADINIDPNAFLKRFDGTADDVRQAYVADLQKNAATDPLASKTLDFLQQSGRFKGNLNDFASAANDKLYGGISRGALRAADFVLPGHNTLGLENEANRQESQPQYTKAGKAGNVFGSTEKGVVDLVSLIVGGGEASAASAAAVKGTKVEETLNNLKKGSDVEKIAAKFLTRAPSFAAETGIQSLQQAGTGEKQNWKKNLAIAGGTELGTQVLGPLVGKGVYALRGGEEGAAKRVLSKLAKSDNESSVTKILHSIFPGADEATTNTLSQYIAQENDPKVISNILDSVSEGGVPIHDWVQSPQLTGQADPNAPVASGDIAPGTFDAANPPQSYLPAGMHAPGAADPVAVLSDKAKGTGSIDDFKKYYSELTGEEKAVADSALNGKTPDEFYNEVKGVKTPTPEEAAQAGTVLHIPDQGVHAKLTPEQAAVLADENKMIPWDSKDRPHLTAGDNVLNGTQEVTQAELAGMSPNTRTALENAQNEIDKAAQSVTPTGEVPGAAAEAPAPADVKPQSGTSAAATQGDIQATNTSADVNANPQVESAKQQVIDSLGGATTAYDEAAATRSVEKGVRAGQGANAFEGAGGGSEGVHAKLKALKGDYSKSGFTIEIPKENMDLLHNNIEGNPELQPWEKTNAQIALMKLNGDVAGGPTPYDIGILRKALGNDFADAVTQAVADNQTTAGKVGETLRQITNAPKSIMASGDISGTARQGWGLIWSNPKQAASAFVKQLKYFASDEGFQKGMQALEQNPHFNDAIESKLAVTGTQALQAEEEQFGSKLVEKIPGLGRLIKASDRGFTGFLSELRMGVFSKQMDIYAKAGIELPAEDKAQLARVINSFSGRGDLGKLLEPHSQSLNTGLFSPKLAKSRWDMINPAFYAKLNGPARKVALQNAAAATAATISLLEMAHLAGFEVGVNPLSSNFGKIKVGNTRYDVTGGYGQNVVLLARELEGKSVSSTTGEEKSLSHPTFGGDNRVSVIGRYLQNKSNPLLSAALQILQGDDRGGNPVNPLTTIANLAVPLPISGAVQIAQDRGSLSDPANLAKAAALELPDIFGISAQTYGTTKTKDKGQPDAVGVPSFKGKVEPNMVTDAMGKVLTDDKGKPITVQFKGNETELEKQAMLDEKRTSALKDSYVRTLPKEDQSLMKLTDSQLQSYVDSGKIDQARYDNIKNIQKTAESESKGNVYDVPKGIGSDVAKQVYQKYNSMNAKDQKYWLSDKNPADDNSKQVTELVNKQRMSGLSEFKPSNALAKLYADYEKSLNTNANLTEVDKRNQAKSFQTAAAKLNLNANQTDIFAEGGSSDLKTLIDNKQVAKADLDAAMKLDEELYNTGLSGSLKFSKKFRETYGYNVPTGGNGPNAGSGSSSSINAHLSAYIPSGKSSGGTGVPQFSRKSRSTPSLTSGVTTPKAPTTGKVTIKL